MWEIEFESLSEKAKLKDCQDYFAMLREMFGDGGTPGSLDAGDIIERGEWLAEQVKRLRKKGAKKNVSSAKKSGDRWDTFERLWNLYPEKKGKHKAWSHFNAQVKTPEDLNNFFGAVANYKKDMAKVRKDHPDRPWLHGDTFFNHRWEDFIDYQAPGKCVEPYKPNKPESLKREDCVPAEDLQKMVKKFNQGLKSVPKASTKFVEPL